MNCTNCGRILPNGARFCTGCGKPVIIANPPKQVQPDPDVKIPESKAEEVKPMMPEPKAVPASAGKPAERPADTPVPAGKPAERPADVPVSAGKPAERPTDVSASAAEAPEDLSAPAAMKRLSSEEGEGDSYFIQIPRRRTAGTAEPVKAAAAEPVKTAEPVRAAVAEPVKTAEPVQTAAAEQRNMAEPAQESRPVGGFNWNRKPEPVGGFDWNKKAEPVGGVDWNKKAEPVGGVDWNKKTEPADRAERNPVAAPVPASAETPVPQEAGKKTATVGSEPATTVPTGTGNSTQAAPGTEDIARVSSAESSGSDIRRFYVIDFLIRMVGIKENIPLFIYLVLNVLLIGGFVTLFTGLNVGLGLLIGLVLYILSMTVALSPFGEWLLRRRTECKPVTEPEVSERLEPIFFEVYMTAKMQDPTLPADIKLFMNDDPSPNAFATGRRTVCVTRGLLSMTDDEIRATLGHEFGHLSHKDTDRILVVTVGNAIITAICVLAQIGAIIFEVMTNITAIFMGEDGAFVRMIASLSRFLTIVLINLFMKLWTAIGVALCMKTSRGNEYQADEFSYHLGYGEGLISMLNRLDGSGARPQGLFANLAASHPATVDRVARLRHLLDGVPMAN